MTARTPVNSDGPLPAALRPVTVPLSWLYGAGVSLRNVRYACHVGVRALPVPTISVGNIVVGGAGKTPFVGWVVGAVQRLGHRPMIALRGYGGDDAKASDEANEHRARDPRVPVVEGANRHRAVTAQLAAGASADCVILDDGFQHRRLHRDLDLVLIDARRPALDGRLLPAGWLRERPAALRRADAVIVTHASAVDHRLAAAIRRHHGRDPIAWVRHEWKRLDIHGPSHGHDSRAASDRAGKVGRHRAAESVGVEWLRGRRLVALLGVADPSSVIATATGAGASIDSLPASDHERYGQRWISQLASRIVACGAEAALMTGKDWAKIGPLLDSAPSDAFPWPVVVPRLRIAPVAGEAALERVIRAVLRPSLASNDTDTQRMETDQ